jgi:L-Ala-D/L-Glu epimerase
MRPVVPTSAPIDWWLLTIPIDERIARARIRYSHHLLVRARGPEHEGWGEAPLYARAPHQVRALRPRLLEVGRDLDLTRPAAARAGLAVTLAGVPDVRSALDGALWELEALDRGCSVARLLGATGSSVPITEQLFADAAAHPSAALPPILERGTQCLKVKLFGDPDVDLKMLRRVRSAVGRDVRLRIDANRGYAPAGALRLAAGLPALGIEEWEEPVEAGFEAIARLREQTGVRVILDESVRSGADLDAAIACGAVDILNLKLSRLGGITAALEYRQRCARDGVEVLIGCNEDLGPGMAAVLHAAAAWSPFETEGVGWVRLGLDIATPSPVVVNGRIELGEKAGWGVVTEPRTRACGSRSRRPLPQPVQLSSWSLPFAALSVARKQHQRACNAQLRAGLLARRAVKTRSLSAATSDQPRGAPL